MVEDLHHSITDFWSNPISRDHCDRLGLASPGEGTYVIFALVCMPQQTR